MQTVIPSIPMREILHFLGWRGTPVEPQLLAQLEALSLRVISEITPHVIVRRFDLDQDGGLCGTAFYPKGGDVKTLLSSCREAVLMAVTLGVQSERMLLREQARSSADALLLDAVLSAAVEAVCDAQEEMLRVQLGKSYLTDRFSPGYGDMPLAQSKEICEVLKTSRSIGLSVSSSGIMIPRKSVTAVMGVSQKPVARRPRGCAGCKMRSTCALRESETRIDEAALGREG